MTIIPNKNLRFTIRISDKDLNSIKSKAKKARLPASQYIIASALNKQISVIDGLPEMVSQLKSLGKNLNQLTMLANMGKVNAVYLDEANRKLDEISDQLYAISEGKS